MFYNEKFSEDIYMSVFVLRAPDLAGNINFCTNDLVNNGIAHYFWSYYDTADLRVIREKLKYSSSQLTKEQLITWKQGHFLLDEVKIGDWLVYINLPSFNHCISAQVIGEYYFDKDGGSLVHRDGRHCIKVNKDTIIEFDRKDIRLSGPLIRKLTYVRGAWYHLDLEKDFFDFMEKIKK